jgi:hypothetical protein
MDTINERNGKNVNAKPYICEKQKEEDVLFDELEKRFVKNNQWIFEDLVDVPNEK